MTEFDYEVLQRKRLAGQARYKKNGSKSKKCPLTTDNMTRKQWIERCGDVMSFQIGKPMKWVEFCSLPKDLKEEYINNLIEKYSINAKILSAMFGVAPVTIYRMVDKEMLNVEFAKGRRMSEEQKIAFDMFLGGNSVSKETANNEQVECSCAQIDGPTEHKPTEDIQKDSQLATKLDGFTMNFSGKIDIDMIANSLRYILGAGSTARVQIICELT